MSAGASGATQVGAAEVKDVAVADAAPPSVGAPTYVDRVRSQLAIALLGSVFVLALLIIILVSAGWRSIGDAKEIVLTIVALFGIVSPVIGFYFATAQRT